MVGRMNTRARVAVWLWAGTVLAVGVVVAIGIAITGRLDIETATLIVSSVAYVVLGLFLSIRRPGNRVAWLLMVVGTWIVSQGLVELAIGADESVIPDPVTVWDVLAIVWGNAGYFVGLLIPLFLLFYIFPTGRFLTRHWALAGWAALAVGWVPLFVEGFAREVGPDGQDWTVPNPFGFHDIQGLGGGWAIYLGMGFIPLALCALPAILVRYHRADPITRAQIKWVFYVLLMIAGIFIVTISLGDQVPDWLSTLFFLVVLTAIPASITIAITRYQLYEIDRIISRTVGYLLIVATLGLVYALGAIWVPTRLLGEQPPIFVAASTLAAAALFNPVRRFVLDRVDRRFNRAKYDRETVLNDFTSGLNDATDLERLREDSLDVVGRTMQPNAVGMWIRT